MRDSLFKQERYNKGVPRNLGTNSYMSPYVETVSCWEFFLAKILQKSSQGSTKVNFFQKTSGRNGDHDDLDDQCFHIM